jgi:hypothetical protein
VHPVSALSPGQEALPIECKVQVDQEIDEDMQLTVIKGLLPSRRP